MNPSMISFKLSEHLGERTLYWLAKESGVSYPTIHKLMKEPPHGISFGVLEKLCDALDCSPGDLLVKVSDKKKGGHSRKSPTSATAVGAVGVSRAKGND